MAFEVIRCCGIDLSPGRVDGAAGG